MVYFCTRKIDKVGNIVIIWLKIEGYNFGRKENQHFLNLVEK